MAAGNVTVTATGKLGPDKSVTALAITDVASVNFRFKDGSVDINKDGGPTICLEYSNLATVTITPSTKVVVLST